MTTKMNNRKAPLILRTSAVLISASFLLPLIYLGLRALENKQAGLWHYLFHPKNLELLSNSLLLIFGVLIIATLIALPLAWLITRTAIRAKSVITVLSVAPLAIPGYVMAFAWLSLTGDYGLLAKLFDWHLPRLSGYWGALIALSFYTFPYLFLNLRSTLLGLDPKLEEAAKGLRASNMTVFWRVILPQCRPALLSSWLIIGVYVLSDFGAVSLMRYETFSYAIFLQYTSSFDRSFAAWLALLAIGLTSVFLMLDSWLLRRYSLINKTANTVFNRQRLILGHWSIIAYGFVAIVFIFSLGVPLSTIIIWMQHATIGAQLADVSQAALYSLSAAIPSALIAAAMGFLLAYHAVYYPSRTTKITERLAFLSYSTPPLALALAFIFLSLKLLPNYYQTFPILIMAYVIHYVALAIGPMRNRLYQIPYTLLEAAYSLNQTAVRTFSHITYRLTKKSYLTGAALVFMLVMKELPLTFLLAPAGFHTLATNVWSYTSEAMFSEAAPYALVTVMVSSLFLGLVLKYEGHHDKFKR